MLTPAPSDITGLTRLRSWLIERMGGLRDRAPVEHEVISTWHRGNHSVTYLRFTYGYDWIPAYLLLPTDAPGPLPPVIALHQHNGQWQLGKREPAGFAGDPSQNYGERLAEAGFAVLIPDGMCFEERASATLDGPSYERYVAMYEFLHGRSLTALMVSDVMASVDLLAAFPQIDTSRVGLIGHSMGGTLTLWATALDARIKAAFVNCGLASLATIVRDEVIHCFMNYVVGQLPACDHPQLAAMIAPRALMISAGSRDIIFPCDGIHDTYDYALGTYDALRVPDKLSLHLEDCGHGFTPTMHAEALTFFNRWLT
jgi:dienelactone hydrolase